LLYGLKEIACVARLIPVGTRWYPDFTRAIRQLLTWVKVLCEVGGKETLPCHRIGQKKQYPEKWSG